MKTKKRPFIKRTAIISVLVMILLTIPIYAATNVPTGDTQGAPLIAIGVALVALAGGGAFFYFKNKRG